MWVYFCLSILLHWSIFIPSPTLQILDYCGFIVFCEVRQWQLLNFVLLFNIIDSSESSSSPYTLWDHSKLLRVYWSQNKLLGFVWYYNEYIDQFRKNVYLGNIEIFSVQSVSRVQLFANPWTAARQASLSITNSQNLLKFMSIESVIASNHLILCHPLLPLPSIFPSIKVFSNESVLHIRWPKHWSFSLASGLPMNI